MNYEQFVTRVIGGWQWTLPASQFPNVDESRGICKNKRDAVAAAEAAATGLHKRLAPAHANPSAKGAEEMRWQRGQEAAWAREANDFDKFRAPLLRRSPLKSYVYLAAPYTDKDRSTQFKRALRASRFAWELMRYGVPIYSPLSHGPAIAEALVPSPQVKEARSASHSFWMEQCRPLLLSAACLLVCEWEGWEKSKGILQECVWARDESIPVYRYNELHGALTMNPVFRHIVDNYGDFVMQRGE